MTDDEFAELVEEALSSLPVEFRPYMENVSVQVRARPTRRETAGLNLPAGSMLLGMYQGVPLTRRSVTAPVAMPDRIVLYRENIERACRGRRAVVRQIRRTVLHEVGHHFGLDEEDLRRLGWG